LQLLPLKAIELISPLTFGAQDVTLNPGVALKLKMLFRG